MFLLLPTGCGADRGDTGGGQGSTSGTGKGGGPGFTFEVPTSTSNGKGGSGSGNGTGENSNCEPNLTGIVRDFTDAHKDFEKYAGSGASKGIVKNELGADRKPVYAHTGTFKDPKNGDQVTSKETFDQWYRDTDGVNMCVEHKLTLTRQPNGISSFDSNAFFRPTTRDSATSRITDTISTSPSSCTPSLCTRVARCSPSRVTTICGSSSTASWPSIWAGCNRAWNNR